MIDLQILNLVLDKKDYSIINLNNLNEDYFPSYKDEFNFIKNHYDKYKVVPDKESFIDKFPNFQFIKVNESLTYLLDGLQEEYLYSKAVPILQKMDELLTGENADSRKAVEYLLSKVPSLTRKLNFEAIDLISQSDIRLKEYEERSKQRDKFYISTGFPELDEIIGGWDRKEEYAVISARPGIGKSFILDYFALHSVRLGLRVGLYSGEMTETKVGYRIDTLFSNISNFKITKGYSDIKEEYEKSISNIKELKGHLFVCTPKMLGGFATVSKLKAFCERYELDILYIDQLSLLDDQNHNRTRFERFESLSRDIKDLQSQLQIPVIMAVQLNRGVEKDEDPDTTNISGSDRVAQDATFILSLQNKDGNIIMQIMKSRDGRHGDKLTYHWDVDKGILTFIPTSNDATKGKHVEEVKNQYEKDGDEVF